MISFLTISNISQSNEEVNIIDHIYVVIENNQWFDQRFYCPSLHTVFLHTLALREKILTVLLVNVKVV